MTTGPRRGLTIGQAAAFAGVTIKTVRHYHQQGLLDEPARDSSGYRRYTSTDLLRLVRVRTLAAASVPLGEITGLLDAGTEQFAAALVEVEQRLTDRIEELSEQRETLRRLATGDRVLLSDRGAAMLDRLAALDFDAGFIESIREATVLARAVAPDFYDSYLTQLERRLDDPAHVELLRRSWQVTTWDVDDPRIEVLATEMAENLLAHRDDMALPAGFEARADSVQRYQVINHHRDEDLPALRRLTALIEARLRAAGIAVPR